MKKNDIYFLITMLIIGFICLLMPAKCQVYGVAGTNTLQVLTPEVRAMMNELPDTLGFCMRDDKYLTHAPQSEIDNLIAWNNSKDLKIIYTVQAAGKSLTENFFDYNLLISAGVKIPIIKIGNENYFTEAGNNRDFNNYLSFAEPIISEANRLGFTGIFLFPVSSENTAWDDLVASYINSNPRYQPDVHFYWGRNDLACFSQLVGTKKDQFPTQILTSSLNLPANQFYSDMYFQVTTSNRISEKMDYYSSKFPGKRLYITEFGPAGNVGNLQNTLGFQATEDYFYNEIKKYPQVEYVLKFNGASPTNTGLISPKSVKDDPTIAGSYIKRLSYYTLYNFLQNKNASHIASISEAGNYCFSYQNMTSLNLSIPVEVSEGLKIESASYEAIKGSSFYSSSGACAWWGSGSVKSYEISGVQTFTDIPAMSYGYIHVSVIPACYDTVITVYDTTYQTIQVANPIPVKCSRFFYSLFHSKECTVTYHSEQQMILTRKEITETICN